MDATHAGDWTAFHGPSARAYRFVYRHDGTGWLFTHQWDLFDGTTSLDEWHPAKRIKALPDDARVLVEQPR